MKIGVTQIILRKYSLDQIIELCQTAGYEVLELTFSEGGDPDINASDEELIRLNERLNEAGIQVTSLIAQYQDAGSLLDPDPKQQELRMKSLTRAVEIAGVMKTGAVLLHPGQLTVEGTYSQTWDAFVGRMREIAPIAEKHQVVVAIENVWNKFLLSPREMRLLLEEVGSDWVGCYLDTANMMAYGYPEHWIDKLGSRIARVHFKDFRRREHSFVPLQEGDTDWPRIMEKLRNIGYDAGVIHEVGGDWDQLIDTARRMREIVSQ